MPSYIENTSSIRCAVVPCTGRLKTRYLSNELGGIPDLFLEREGAEFREVEGRG